MENHRDDHIVCADCGASFLFSAGEAAVFQERGLAAPKRCKDCRRARKERTQGGEGGARGPRPAFGGGGGGGWNGGGRDAAPRGPRPDGGRPRMGSGAGRGPAPQFGAPRYTGDVNEYRSPMADGGWQPAAAQGNRPPAQQGNGWQPRPPRRQGGPGVYRHDDGQYRAPSGQTDGFPRGDSLPRGDSFARGDRARAAAPAPAASAAPAAAARRRPQAETFSITCSSCGVSAEVPFKPAEGREVFCQACYRARKPPV
jgi:CxxC-x17-CxxC domain-containing protein